MSKIKCSMVHLQAGFSVIFICLCTLFVNYSICADHPTCLEFRSSHSDMFDKRSVLENFATFIEKHLCWSVPFKEVIKEFIERNITAQMFPCEF